MQKLAQMYARFGFVNAFTNLVQMFQYLATQALASVYVIIAARSFVLRHYMALFSGWLFTKQQLCCINVGTEKVCCGALNRNIFTTLDVLYKLLLVRAYKTISLFIGDFVQRIIRPAYEKLLLLVVCATLFFKEVAHSALSAILVAYVCGAFLRELLSVFCFTHFITLLTRTIAAYLYPAIRMLWAQMCTGVDTQYSITLYIGCTQPSLCWVSVLVYLLLHLYSLLCICILCELYYSENAARAQSMEVIRTNLINIRTFLQRTYNMLRQNTITASLMDVVASLVVLVNSYRPKLTLLLLRLLHI